MTTDAYRQASGDQCDHDDDYELLVGPRGFSCLLTEPEDRRWCRDLKPVIAELNCLNKRVEEMNDAFAKIRMTVMSEPDDEFPWLTEELLMLIDSVMTKEYRT